MGHLAGGLGGASGALAWTCDDGGRRAYVGQSGYPAGKRAWSRSHIRDRDARVRRIPCLASDPEPAVQTCSCSMKAAHLLCYDYQHGRGWAFVLAASRDGITENNPELQVVDLTPVWITQAVIERVGSPMTVA